MPKSRSIAFRLLCLIPFGIALWVWLSALAFVPVPWPDDSAFYFVAHELFKWPPRWVMLPQAPFEPTYRIFNFNTMPLYPLLIGIGRYLGIDGTFALKFWPLTAWATSGAILVGALYRAGLPLLFCTLLALTFALDPTLRWGSTLLRPESLIGCCGIALILGLTLGFPKRFQPKGWYWHPVSALLAIAAYAHFNAIHLLFPVIFALALQPAALIEIGLKTLLYLSPWILTVLWHASLFVHQMRTQWVRLAIHNDWLSTPARALSKLFIDMGSPEPWPSTLQWVAMGMWILILIALALLLNQIWDLLTQRQRRSSLYYFVPSTGWVFGAIWLWHTKPEAWFIYYIHTSIWTFTGLAALYLWKKRSRRFFVALNLMLVFIGGIFADVDIRQAIRLNSTGSWHWETYYSFIDCIDSRLSELETHLGHPNPFRIWNPTFPDVTVELSRRHPQWEFTRTNDFMDRAHLAIQHGREVEAVVVSETLNWYERNISAPAEKYPEITSTWMTWKGYFLYHLWREAGWKPNRYLCQKGRWQAFLFMENEPKP